MGVESCDKFLALFLLMSLIDVCHRVVDSLSTT